MSSRVLTALPVYNELHHVGPVLDEVVRYGKDVLVVDDGSTDGTSDLLAARQDILLVRHDKNRGYGAALHTAFAYAVEHGYDVLVTIDCDGQHQPSRIPEFVAAIENSDADIVSGSRYLKQYDGDSAPPVDRRRINQQITDELNCRLGLHLTDTFCGFKSYRVSALAKLKLVDTGYAMPLEVWVQAAAWGFTVVELPVELIYLDEKRSFGGSLDNSVTRLAHYHDVIERSLEAAKPLVAGRPASSSCCGCGAAHQ